MPNTSSLTQEKFYKPSGKTSIGSLLLLLITTTLVALIAGVVYDQIVDLVPLVLLSILATFFLGLTIGRTSAFLIKKGHIRNPLLATACSLFAALVACYSAWMSCIILRAFTVSPALFPETALELLPNPQLVLFFIEEINEVGLWSLKNSAVTGIPLLLVWIGELLIIVGMSVAPAWKAAKKPYSELTQTWMRTDTTPTVVLECPKENWKQLIAELKSGAVHLLMQRKDVENSDECSSKECTTLILNFFTADQDPNIFMTLSTPTPKGNKTNELITNLRIDAATLKRLVTSNPQYASGQANTHKTILGDDAQGI